MSATSPGEKLLRGRRAIDDVEDISIVGDLRPYGAQWGLQVYIDIGQGTTYFPRISSWFVLVDAAYPEGAIGVFPAEKGGISATFPHQLRNERANGNDWRSGKLCLDEPSAILGRVVRDGEPRGVDHRLAWHVRRAVAWARAASRGELLGPGAEFELPAMPVVKPNPVVLLQEGTGSFSRWANAPCTGAVAWAAHAHLAVVGAFTSAAQFRIDPAWGAWGARLKFDRRAAWVITPELPVLDPWRAPATWGELGLAFSRVGMDLDPVLRAATESLRGQSVPLLFCGTPIPTVVEGEAVEMHWQVLQLPALARRKGRGARLWKRDRALLSDEKVLPWLTVENVAPERLRARGALRESVGSLRYMIVGVGALGSAIGELLAREGVREFVLVDGDLFAAGNLARHSLTVEQLALSKAKEVAKRLAAVAPGARIRATVGNIPEDALKLLDDADVIIDLTGSDDALVALSTSQCDTMKKWFSAWMSYGARHLFVFSATGRSFPLPTFRKLTDPLLDATRPSVESGVREGPGCWHPLFPARASDVAMLAAAAVRAIEARLHGMHDEPAVTAFERVEHEDGISTLRRLEAQP